MRQPNNAPCAPGSKTLQSAQTSLQAQAQAQAHDSSSSTYSITMSYSIPQTANIMTRTPPKGSAKEASPASATRRQAGRGSRSLYPGGSTFACRSRRSLPLACSLGKTGRAEGRQIFPCTPPSRRAAARWLCGGGCDWAQLQGWPSCVQSISQ